MISKESKERILKRLQQENARSPYLNSLPGRLNSYSKLDLAYLPEFNTRLNKKITTSIAGGKGFVYHHDPDKSLTTIPHDNAIQRCVKNIVDKAKINLTETGSETLAVGYPILITRSSSSTTDCKAIPLFIWPVTIKSETLANRWKFSFSKELPSINQSFLGHIESDQVPINVGKLYKDFIEENLESLDLDKLQVLFDEFTADNSSIISRFPDTWGKLEKMPFETKTAMKDGSEQGMRIEIYNSAVLTNYKESKFSIIKDFNNFGDSIPDISKASSKVSEVSATVLDPSQSGVIEDINTLNHVVLHGPPGTGKSQTITGIITAGLANNLKIAVVCQKAAAINVLIDNLSDLGISKEVLKVTNISSDRKNVIEKARAFENSKEPRAITPLAKTITNTFNNIGSRVVNAHLRTREEKLTEFYNWNESVGELSKLKRLYPVLETLDFTPQWEQWSENSDFSHKLAEELDDLLLELSNFGENIKYLNTDYSDGEPFVELRAYIDQLSILITKSDSHLNIQRDGVYNQQEAVFRTLGTDLKEAENNLLEAEELKKSCERNSTGLRWMTLNTDLSSIDPEVIKVNIDALVDVRATLSIDLANITEFLASDKYIKFIGGLTTSEIEIQRQRIYNQQESVLSSLRADLKEAENNLLEAEELKKSCERNSTGLRWMTLNTDLSSIDPEVIKVNIDALVEVRATLSIDLANITEFLASDEYDKFNELSGLKKLFTSFSKDYKLFKRQKNELISTSGHYGLKSLKTTEFDKLLDRLNITIKAQENIYQLANSQLGLFEKHVVLVKAEEVTRSNNNTEFSGALDFEEAIDLHFFNNAISVMVKQISDVQHDLTETILFRYEKTFQFDGIKKYEVDYAANLKDYKLFKSQQNYLVTRSGHYGVNDLTIKELDNLLDRLNIIIKAQENIRQLSISQLDLFNKHVVTYGSNLPFFDKAIDVISKQLSDINHDLTEAILFRYEKTDHFDSIKEYEVDYATNLSIKESLNTPGRLLNTEFSEVAIESPGKGLEILAGIEEKGLSLEELVTLFDKSRVFNSGLEISDRGKVSFKNELTYGILQYVTKNHYGKHKNHLPKNSFNNQIIKQGDSLKLIQKQVIKKALYNGKLRRAQAVQSIENKASSFAKVFSHRGRNKKTLRQITQKYRNEFTELFPVMMMTPEVSCNLFEVSHLHFDLLIVDEASQVELHDILPVLYKGKTLVIAGDQHQMPPSNFFSKHIDLEDEEEEDDMEPLIDVESLLEFCQSSPQFKSRFLDFHYRSNHKGLIDFSNDAIYKRLVIKPTKDWEYAPFLLSRVHNGTWVNQRNELEALRVIGLIKDLDINQRSVPHLLVATLNAPHRKEIQDQIASEISQNPEFEKRMQLLDSHGFDIKNLENLQGDECDLLIISTGYGQGLDGKFRQNLGVINREKGYRLLNVLITRAKYKVILVTSIPKRAYQEYLDVLKSGKIGRGLLYAYIAFVEAHTQKNHSALKNISKLLVDYGIQNTVIGDTRSLEVFDSPFEEEVYEFLIKHYSSEKITLQEEHVNSGFRIDMVLKPHGEKGPRIAIECDGAAFHSGWKNQTLDLHRQNLLEDAGYKFIRVWSTDWWRIQDICESSILGDIKAYLKDHAPLDFKEEKWLTLKDEIVEDDEWEPAIPIDLVSDDVVEIHEHVVSKDCIVNLSTDNKSRPNVVLSIVPNQGRVIKENTNGIIYLVFNMDLPMALIGNKVGSSVNFNTTTYKIESIE